MSDNIKNNECKIIVLPEIAELQKDIDRLRTELSMLLLERDELKFVQCKNIETAYMLALGGLEYKAYEAECTVLRLKRKMELIQIKKNRQDKVIIEDIENLLDEEFIEYKKKLDDQISKMNEALERGKCEFLSEEETKELKSLYRKIVKSLHPDLHPDISDAQLKLFHNAVSAYENGDLGALRIISDMVAEPTLPENNSDGIKALIEEKKRLEENVKHINEAIISIKGDYPYILKFIVEDPAKIEEKRAELEEIITELKELIDIYTNKIAEMLR